MARRLHAEVGRSRRRRVLATTECDGVGKSISIQCEAKMGGTAGWDEAAWGILQMLEERNVCRGQLLSIDAHSENGLPIISAHYAADLQDNCPLKLCFSGRAGITDSWDQICRTACDEARGKDIISMTGSCEADGTSAFYVFYNAEITRDQGKIEYAECSADSWNAAAQGLIKLLSSKGVRDGQIINIDAHNNGPNEAAMFAAFFCRSWPSKGNLNLVSWHQNDDIPWEKMYESVTKSVEAVHKEQLLGITGSCNMHRRVMYAFWQVSAQTSTIQYVESRASSWNGAADGLIKKLEEAGVRQGQVLSIDAHNSGENEQSIFSAHYLKSLEDRGELDIGYTAQNSSSSWETLYTEASKHAEGKDVISMTGSINTSDRSVFYVFFNKGTADAGVDNVEHVESRAGSWNEAADGIIKKLREHEVQSGQILSIDAHNNGRNEAAIFSAHYSKTLPGYGKPRLRFRCQNTAASWDHQYHTACWQLANIRTSPDQFVSLTACCNAADRSVTYVFTDHAISNSCRNPDSLEDSEWFEHRASSWNAAADGIISRLLEEEIGKGQVLSIDAHNNGENQAAIFSAHVCRNLPSKGTLNIGYVAQNSDKTFAEFYAQACKDANGKDIVSMTGSCNTDDRAVFYVFFNKDSPSDLDGVEFVEASQKTWSGAARQIVEALEEQGVQSGQILSINAMIRQASGGTPTFSAHYSKKVQAKGKLRLRWSDLNSEAPWAHFYDNAMETLAGLRQKEFLSCTASASSPNSSVMYVWYQDSKSGSYESDAPLKSWSLEGVWQLQAKSGKTSFIDLSDPTNITLLGEGVCGSWYDGQLDFSTKHPRFEAKWEVTPEGSAARSGKVQGCFSGPKRFSYTSTPAIMDESPLGAGFGLKILNPASVDENSAKSIDLKELQELGPGCMPEDPTYWAISLRQLQHLRALMRQEGFFVGYERVVNFESGTMSLEVDGNHVVSKVGDEAKALGVQVGWTAYGIDHDLFCEAHLSERSADGKSHMMFFRDTKGTFDANMYQVNLSYVKPLTKDLDISLALLYNRKVGGRKATVFISHAWAESFLYFLAVLETGIGTQQPLSLDDYAWICTFGVNQNMTAEDISGAIASPADSPFARVLQSVSEVAVIFNDRVNLYSRVWCVFEAFVALEQGKLVRCLGLPPNWRDAVVGILVSPEHEWVQRITGFCEKHKMNVLDATASVLEDKIAILEALQGQEDQVNDRTNCLQEWALKDIIVGQFSGLMDQVGASEIPAA